MKYYGDIELISAQIINLKVETLTTLPTFDSDDESRVVYNSATKSLYVNNGTDYHALQYASESSEPVLVALAGNPTSPTYWFNLDNSFNPTPFHNLPGGFFSTSTNSLFSVISQINDALISLNTISINDIQNFAVNDPVAGDIIYFDGTNFVAQNLTNIPNFGINIALSNLTDVVLPTTGALIPVDNDILFFDSSVQGGKFINKHVFVKLENTNPQSSYTFTHNLGHQYCAVTVFDLATNTILTPTSVTCTNTSTLTIGLGSIASSGVIVYVSTIPVQN